MKYLTLILFILIIYFYSFTYEYPLIKYNTELIKDGFLVFNKHLSRNNVLNYLPDDYVFLDYRYEIKGCTLSTFHRDVTSSRYEFKCRHPVYTYICYFNKGNHLSICPGSHKQAPFLFNRAKIISSNSNKCSVLFDCDIVHAGYLNNYQDKNRHAIQFKIVHKDDLKHLIHLQGIDKTVKDDCLQFNYLYELFLRKITLFNSFIVNHCFTKYLQNDQNNLLSKLVTKVTNKKFYNK